VSFRKEFHVLVGRKHLSLRQRLLDESAHFLLKSRKRHTRLQASNEIEPTRLRVVNVRDISNRRHRLDRQVEFRWRSSESIAIEALRSDACDGDGLSVDEKGAADDRGITRVGSLPSFVAHDGHGRRAFAIVLVREEPPCVRVKTEGAEIVAGDELAHNGAGVFVRSSTTNREGPISEASLDGGQVFELGEIRPKEFIGGRGEERVVASVPGARSDAAVIAVTQTNKILGVADGQIFEEDGVDEGEDGGVGADAERESENNGGGEAGSLRELTKSETQVLQEMFEPVPAPCSAGVFANERAVAENA